MSARPRALSAFFVLLLLLPSLPLGAAASHATEPVSAVGPQADGSFTLTFDVIRAVAGNATLAFDVAVTPDDSPGTVARANRTLGTFEIAAGVTRLALPFLPVEGSGEYAVTLLADSRGGDALRFRVEQGDGASADVSFTIPDEPTRLTLTSDSVNGDLKLKSPGDAVVTRATLEDGNGRGDIERLVARIERQDASGAWTLFDEPVVPIDADANATKVAVEHRYARSPIPAATYRLTLVAQRAGLDLANASRTFVIREVAPTLVSGALPATVLPDHNQTLVADVVLGDRNGFANATVEARVYRGSTRVEGQGFAVSLGGAGNVTNLGAAQPQPDADGQARVLVPLALRVPAQATSGAHRVSLYVDGALLGSLPFDVAPLPRLLDVTAKPSANALRLTVNGTGDGWLVARLADDQGAATTTAVALVAGAATLEVEAPSAANSLRWTVALHARADGPALEQRSGLWNRTGEGPLFVVVPERVGARLPATWRIEAPGWDAGASTATLRVHRWDGAVESALGARLDADGRVTVNGPPTIAPGRYEVRATLAFPNGTTADVAWSFETGPWMRLAVGQIVVEGREARIEVENVGGVALPRFLLESGGASALQGASYSWSAGNSTRALDAQGARRLAGDVNLAPGEKGTLVVRLPEGPLPSGELRGQIRLLALPGGA